MAYDDRDRERPSRMMDRESRMDNRMLESQIQDLKKEVKRLTEQAEDNLQTMTQLMANYKMFKQSVEKMITEMDSDGRAFEKVTTDWAEEASEALQNTESEQNQNAFGEMIAKLLENDLVARENALREEFYRNAQGGKKESGGGLSITFIISIINLVAVGYLFIKIFRII